MKKEIADMWVAALRSGKFRQGQGVLHRLSENSFCCLGVLCELAKEAIPDKIEVGAHETSTDLAAYNGSSHLLPLAVQTWAGMRYEDGAFHSRWKLRLSAMNDVGHTFIEIADAIEVNYKDL